MKSIVREILRATLDRYNSESAVLMKEIGDAERALASLRAKHAETEAVVQALSDALKERIGMTDSDFKEQG